MTHAEILNGSGNWSVVQLPGRAFPGVVFQGDSLSILVDELSEALDALRSSKPEEAEDQLALTLERLLEVKASYELALTAAGVVPPYQA